MRRALRVRLRPNVRSRAGSRIRRGGILILGGRRRSTNVALPAACAVALMAEEVLAHINGEAARQLYVTSSRSVARTTVRIWLRIFSASVPLATLFPVSTTLSYPDGDWVFVDNNYRSDKIKLIKENTDEIHDQLVRASTRIAYGV